MTPGYFLSCNQVPIVLPNKEELVPRYTAKQLTFLSFQKMISYIISMRNNCQDWERRVIISFFKISLLLTIKIYWS